VIVTRDLDLTILIPARNAASTIERAVASARAQDPAHILLIDHASDDDTVERASRAGGGRLSVVAAPAAARLGAVRQMGLDAVATPFGMWLDADDELMPGRAERLLARLREDDAELAFDEADLHDGATGRFLRRLPFPNLLGEGRQIVRVFERNYIPAPGVPAFRTATARAIGFDPEQHGPEDYDFLLRSIVAGHRVVLERRAGYRQFAFRSSISRDRENQAAMVRAALRKHPPAVVYDLFTRAGFSPRTCAWGMVGFLTLRGDFQEALLWLDRVPPGSRRDFHQGTLLAALGFHQAAADPLRRAIDDCISPELLNNYGVVLAALDRIEEAADMFGDALYHFPGYSDARANLLSGAPSRLTLLPLRDHAARSDYD
jgi:glycosyltransferase involved in cell wall biosynthesis